MDEEEKGGNGRGGEGRKWVEMDEEEKGGSGMKEKVKRGPRRHSLPKP